MSAKNIRNRRKTMHESVENNAAPVRSVIEIQNEAPLSVVLQVA